MSDRANARVSSAAKRRWTNSAAQKAVKYIKNILVKLLDRQNLLTYIILCNSIRLEGEGYAIDA